ncbi:MAG: multifunctional 2',3'-cyclic-nucleotide 2'-phosphodiesterase/5'-nucleotidase/3'-nucleotidase [Paracoccus denitrificans]|uniref:Multifunctional 2',3'-cyclic-nucleotide 2'-phosphodiesterase/5'-nucleotidase/3'-nucleotidase n=1 Tax=Paracoccus denitrificans TaxID=266 RepID=A0A533I8S8_PARDE|nr:MAG: multifunctional 2',3'-cyclic-nucleotide 2'-phosphodiesterase/5'-nucleotidase/3'-nucleotidase [Paracoccus denitrificans]
MTKTQLLASAAALALMAGAAQAETVLHILHTNDFHSRVESINKYDSTCDAETETAGECFGGTARLATKLAELRAQFEAAGEPVILLDGGDQFQGSLFYTTYKGEDTAEFMNKLGYDAMAVGNHEFDDGPETLAALIENAEFPIISANIDASQSNVLNERLLRSTVLDLGGEKIGIVGGTTMETPEISSPGDSLIFQDDIEAITADVQKLTDEGVSKIIALTHIGYGHEQEIAAAVPGLDALVGGHSHTYLSSTDDSAAGPYPTMVAGADGVEVPVVQAASYGKYLGHLRLTFDDDGKVIAADGEPILIDASVEPDAEILARIKELAAPIDELKNKIVAETAGEISADRTICRAQECVMGSLVADAMLDRVKGQGVSIAIQNGGGLRASIDAGPISMGEIISVLPFQNTLATFKLKGADVVAALENGASQIEEEAGRFSQVAGLKYTVDPAAEVGSRISDVQVMRDGAWAPIDEAAEYGVVSNNYMRNGGDGYDVFATNATNVYDFGPDLADVLAEYIVKQGPDFSPATDGRISVVNAPAEAADAAPAEAAPAATEADTAPAAQ